MAGPESPRASVCPGCGLDLPAEPASPASPLNASRECWRLCGEVTGTAMTDPVLGRLHQLTVDAYAAQHAGEGVPAINTAFALIGLHLALDGDVSGLEVRDAHQRLARRRRSWPLFPVPAALGSLGVTILDVALAESPQAHGEALRRWARAVWGGWRSEHEAVAALARDGA